MDLNNETELSTDDNTNKSPFSAMYQQKLNGVEESNVQPVKRLIILAIVTFLSLLLPHIGLIFYFLWHKDKPSDAKWPGIAALLSIIISLSLYTLSILPRLF